MLRSLSLLFAIFFLQISSVLAADQIGTQVKATGEAHGLSAWWGKDVVQADVEIIFGGNKAVDGNFIFEANGPRARYDRADGTSIIFDGKTAWVTPGDAEAPKGRFHVLTWPWFIMAPFKMQGEGIELSEYSEKSFLGKNYATFLQTFSDGMGDTPEDWYRFFIDPKTDQIEAMSYIVTYGKDSATAKKQPSIIRYLDYENFEGTVIATRYESWFFDAEKTELIGEGPKATGKVENVTFLKADDSYFKVPAGATELPAPEAAKPVKSAVSHPNYSDFARLLETYVKPAGVDYKTWAATPKDLAALGSFLEYAAEMGLKSLSKADQKAFYINLYNAAMLQAVFDNYPIKSVADIGEPFSIFKKEFIRLGSRKLSLDGVEKGILLKDFFDPRIHFAVNCASESCPPLRAEPFVGDRLEAQLDEQTRLFAESDRAARVDSAKKRIAYSELFKWYAKDFEGSGKHPAAYLNEYRKGPLSLKFEIDWIPYDWALNAVN